jgi:hypothetical protein
VSHPAKLALDAFAVGHETDAVRQHLGACPDCTRYVERLQRGSQATASDRTATDRFLAETQARASRRPRWATWGPVTMALAVAACLLLYLHRPKVEPERVAMRFKGGVQLVVVVDHDGSQTMRTDPVELAPGDRIRLEIALDHDQEIVAGVLADDGEWAELQPTATLPIGTHYSEHSVAFDHAVPHGWVLAGPGAAVEKARKTHDLREVSALRIGPQSP